MLLHKHKQEIKVFWHDGKWEVRQGQIVLGRFLMLSDVRQYLHEAEAA